ncbi:hypothetical protein [Changchengzhania lutea]|uniref:hypothetical protein n=1 Tax=Changchengzhania lutea TaxID=2049305 RepID=UPI00115F2765|nr:hypothetical protein [Changchengzhania lutea]
MININIQFQNISFKEKTISIFNKYKLEIKQVILFRDKIIILGMPKRHLTPPCDYIDKDFSKDNVFVFDLQGSLLSNFGSRKENNDFISYSDYIEIEGENLKLYYQSNYEAWCDIDSGKFIREEYVFKK